MNWHRQKIIVASLLLLALGTAAWGADDFKLVRGVRVIPERGQVNSVQITSESWNFSIIVPPGWRLGTSEKEKKVVLQTADLSARMELRFTERANANSIREQILNGGMRSRITKEYEWPTPAGRAFALEVEQATAQNLRLKSWRVFFTQEQGTMEFSLSGDAGKVGKHQKALENLVASLRTN